MADLPDQDPPFGTVVFDCDSTLSAIEGIEELARDCRDEVTELTNRAMNGELPLEAAYGARLELIQPSRAAVDAVAGLYLERALPHARELVLALSALDKRVVVVSGGLLPAVEPFARALGVHGDASVHAVDLRFDAAGGYAGFDETSPLARSGGKVPVLRAIAAREGAGAVAFVGDGATDLEAAGEVQRFIAYGGVARRANVFDAARVTCEQPDLAALLPLVTSAEERATLRASGAHETLLAASERCAPA